MRRILDDRQPTLGGKAVELREVARLPAVMHGHDRLAYAP